LYPRAENNPATRVRTPGLSSTRTEIVCRLMRSVPPPGRPAAAGPPVP
jgi:hypothetical protein